MEAARPHTDKRSQQLRKLTAVSRALTYAVSLGEVLDLTVRRAAELLDAERAVLMLADEEGLLSVKASCGLEDEVLDDFHEPLQETLIVRVQKLLRTSSDTHFLGVPLVVNGEVTGLLAVACPDSAGDADELEWLLSALADQAAVALEKTRLDLTAEFRERLIGIVSHDLRNPVSVILMATATLRRWEQLDAAGIAKLITRIEGAGRQASALIRDLLDFTQARLGGGIHISPKAADLHVIVSQVVEELEIAYPNRRITLEQSGNGQGQWDAARLAQVMGNLLVNAIKYSPEDSAVQVKTTGESGHVQIVVHNAGAAIPAERLPDLFEPMQRATSELTNDHRSVGLGLYIVKHIVEAHAGQVRAESADGKGTTLTVLLPRAGSPESAEG